MALLAKAIYRFNAIYIKQQTTNAGGDAWKKNPSNTIDVNVN
jgi:hypothetical protein